MLSTFDLSCEVSDGNGSGLIEQAKLLKVEKKSGQFPDESAKNKRRTSSQRRRTKVLATSGIKKMR
jgi:hypothetical protein